MRFAGSLIAFAVIICWGSRTAAVTISEPDGALYLTPMIRAKQINKARTACEVKSLKATVKSCSGYLTVNDTARSNLFFWFFPAMIDAADAPVVLWLQGGPGVSSLYGLFEEHGPFSVAKSHGGLKLRNHTWVYTHSVLYVDNPVGTGFSFTDDTGYSTDQSSVGLNMYEALVQFFTLFSEYQKNDFYVTGESYAGKYVPAVSYAIHLNNPSALVKINLKGLAIGNGLIDPINQFVYSGYLYQHGFLDDMGRAQFEALENKARAEILGGDFMAAFHTFDMLLYGDVYPYPTLFRNLTGMEYYYNMLWDRDPKPYGNWSEYVQHPNIRSALHVGKRPLNDGKLVKHHLMNDMMQSVSSWLAVLLNDGQYRVLLYSGQLDIIVPYRGTMRMAQSLKWSGAENFKKAKRTTWMLTEPNSNYPLVAGYTTTSGPLTVLLVRNAGHMVPGDQPVAGIDLINRFTTGEPF